MGQHTSEAPNRLDRRKARTRAALIRAALAGRVFEEGDR